MLLSSHLCHADQISCLHGQEEWGEVHLLEVGHHLGLAPGNLCPVLVSPRPGHLTPDVSLNPGSGGQEVIISLIGAGGTLTGKPPLTESGLVKIICLVDQLMLLNLPFPKLLLLSYVH